MSRLSSILLLAAAQAAAAAQSFQVQSDAFMLNGQEVTLMSGSFHYHRAHPSTWADRLARMAAMGLNSVQFYIPWNFHEVDRGVFDWGAYDPARNLSNFLTLAQQAGLLALVRPGPYICGEHDFGGMPARLLNISGIVLRANNTQYLAEVDIYWASALGQLKPHLVANGGNVAMVQMENEFGSYGNTGGNPADAAYIRHLKDSAYAILGGASQVQLYTTDGGDAGYLTHGALPGEIFATGDGGPDIDPPSFWAAEDQFNPAGWRAHTDSEYYTGWLTHWGESMANTSTLAVVSGISVILNYNGSFNLYMAYGGTNWGFWNGANGGGTGFQPVITSYDYNSPIAEGGTHGYAADGDKFSAMKRVLSYWAPIKNRRTPFPPEPAQPIATAYAGTSLSSYVPLLANPTTTASILPILSNTGGSITTAGPAPNSLEYYGQKHGYAVFTTPLPNVNAGQDSTLTFGFVADLAYVWCTTSAGVQTYVGRMWRPEAKYSLTVPGACVYAGSKLTILLQNAGHVNYGHGFTDPKGFFPAGGPGNAGPVATLAGTALPGPWTVVPMDMHNRSIAGIAPYYTAAPAGGFTGPAFYTGSMSFAGAPTDTYITLCGWGKGFVLINGHNIGRYWEAQGPQHAFYIPAALLNGNNAPNTITVFEEVAAPAGYAIGFVNGPDFTGASCKAATEKKEQERAAAVALPPAPVSSGATCPTSFASGQPISMQDCASSGTSSVWAPVVVDQASYTVVMTLKANPSLCLSVNDTATSAERSTALARQQKKAEQKSRMLHRGAASPSDLVQQLLPSGVRPAAAPYNTEGASTNMVLAPCAAGYSDRGQHFMYFEDLPGAALMSVTRGNCLDVYGGGTAPGTPLEVYGCTGNSNQAWTFQAGGQVSSKASGLCIAAC